MKKVYIQQANLKEIFDLSVDYFTSRINKEFFEGIHFHVPPSNSNTKRAVLWDYEKLDSWINSSPTKDNVLDLLKRK